MFVQSAFVPLDLEIPKLLRRDLTQRVASTNPNVGRAIAQRVCQSRDRYKGLSPEPHQCLSRRLSNRRIGALQTSHKCGHGNRRFTFQVTEHQHRKLCDPRICGICNTFRQHRNHLTGYVGHARHKGKSNDTVSPTRVLPVADDTQQHWQAVSPKRPQSISRHHRHVRRSFVNEPRQFRHRPRRPLSQHSNGLCCSPCPRRCPRSTYVRFRVILNQLERDFFGQVRNLCPPWRLLVPDPFNEPRKRIRSQSGDCICRILRPIPLCGQKGFRTRTNVDLLNPIAQRMPKLRRLCIPKHQQTSREHNEQTHKKSSNSPLSHAAILSLSASTLNNQLSSTAE